MLISHEFDQTLAQLYKQKVDARTKKAKHLAERVRLFKKELDGLKLKEKDKQNILDIFKQ